MSLYDRTEDVTPEDDLPKRPERRTPEADRYERFRELGFARMQAQALAMSRDSSGVFLYWGEVKKALDGGCKHSLAFRIFCTLEPSGN